MEHPALNPSIALLWPAEYPMNLLDPLARQVAAIEPREHSELLAGTAKRQESEELRSVLPREVPSMQVTELLGGFDPNR